MCYTLPGMQQISIQSPFVGKRQFLRADGTPFWEFLEENEIAYDKAHFPFLSNHTKPRVKRLFDFDEYLQLGSRGSAIAYLYKGLGKALNYVGPVLDLELEHGFNDHTDRHTLWVSQKAVELLKRSGYSFDNLADYFGPKSEVLVTLVGMMHDLGNFMDRRDHSTYSAWILTRLFDTTDKHPEMWWATLYSVLFHEEPVLLQHGVKLSEGIPMQWALVAADKMHVGRDRIGGRSFESGIAHGALEDDVHILLEALIVRSAWYFEVGTFVWHLDFSIDQLEEKFASFTKGNRRLWVPQLFQRLLLDQGKMYRETFAEMFSQHYGNRMRMAAESVFHLFSFVNRFEVRLTDTDTRGKVGSGQMSIWQVKRGRFVESGENETEKRWWVRG